MKRVVLYLGMLGLILALVGPASAVTIGTITGTGSVTVDSTGQPTAYSFNGNFAYDNVTTYWDSVNSQWVTFKTIMGDGGQYTFSANSAGGLTALDSNGSHSPIYNQGTNFKWILDNPVGQNTNLFGTALSFTFTPSDATQGTVTGTVTSSDGYFHWYYGNDGDPGGETLISAFGMSNTFLVSGTYTQTGWTPANGTEAFTLNATLNAVPLPPSVLLLGSGLLGMSLLGWRRKTKLI